VLISDNGTMIIHLCLGSFGFSLYYFDLLIIVVYFLSVINKREIEKN